MRRVITRTLAILAGVLLLALSAARLFVARTWDRVWNAPLPDLHASTDPAIVARGEYLAFGPAHCVECHVPSIEDYDKAAEAGTRPPLVGGMKFAAPPLGAIYSRNLTPDTVTGIGRYSDAQLARMLRYAVRPDGHASVQLLMPYGDMADADIVAIISYLRAQPAVSRVVPENDWTIIGKVVKSFAPVFKPRTAVRPGAQSPTSAPTRERGEYLARNVANCVACHTERDPMSFAPVRPEFAGGNEMEPAERDGAEKSVWFRTPNQTPSRGSAAVGSTPDRRCLGRVLDG